MTIASIYEKLEGLLRKLPEGLHQPILREAEPLKSLFISQRPPRLVLLGEREASRSALVNCLFNASVAHHTEDALQDGAWQAFSYNGAILRVLDARRPATLDRVRGALATESPDLYVFAQTSGPIAGHSMPEELAHAGDIIAFADGRHTERATVLGISMGETAQAADVDRLHGALCLKAHIAERVAGCALLSQRDKVVAGMAGALPPQAHIELARLTSYRDLQIQIAGILVKSAAAVSAVVGAQPIPLADLPVLTTIQAMTAAGVMHVSGRQYNIRAAGEFLGALGANLGLAIVLRTAARTVVKLLPGWGNAISGGVAAAGTYAVGRAAVAYFIEGVSIADARKVFSKRYRTKRKPATLSDRPQ